MGFSTNGGPPKRWFIRENPIEMDDLGVPPFMETSICLDFLALHPFSHALIRALKPQQHVESCPVQPHGSPACPTMSHYGCQAANRIWWNSCESVHVADHVQCLQPQTKLFAGTDGRAET